MKPQWQLISENKFMKLSTVLLPSFYSTIFGNPAAKYESCIFWPNYSDVVMTYATKEAAFIGHNKLCKKFKLENTIEIDKSKNDVSEGNE